MHLFCSTVPKANKTFVLQLGMLPSCLQCILSYLGARYLPRREVSPACCRALCRQTDVFVTLVKQRAVRLQQHLVQSCHEETSVRALSLPRTPRSSGFPLAAVPDRQQCLFPSEAVSLARCSAFMGIFPINKQGYSASCQSSKCWEVLMIQSVPTEDYLEKEEKKKKKSTF